jgi:hypothetical protein
MARPVPAASIRPVTSIPVGLAPDRGTFAGQIRRWNEDHATFEDDPPYIKHGELVTGVLGGVVRRDEPSPDV